MIHRWSEVPKEQINPLVGRQMIHTDKMTIGRFDLLKGATVAEHSHHNEQITTIEKGRLRFLLDGKEIIVGVGECLASPAQAKHSAEALEDTIAVDFFTPPREDWIRGTDSYLRK